MQATVDRQRIEVLELPYAHCRVPGDQRVVKTGVALRTESPILAKRAVQAKYSVILQDTADEYEHFDDRSVTHYVCGI